MALRANRNEKQRGLQDEKDNAEVVGEADPRVGLCR